MRPAAIVDRELERGGVVAVGIETQCDAIVLGEIGVTWARRVVGAVVDAFLLWAADREVQELVVAGELDFDRLGVWATETCRSSRRRSALVQKGSSRLPSRLGGSTMRATGGEFFRGREFGRLCEPLLGRRASSPRIGFRQVAQCEIEPLSRVGEAKFALRRRFGEANAGFGVKRGASGFQIVGELGGAAEAIVARETTRGRCVRADSFRGARLMDCVFAICSDTFCSANCRRRALLGSHALSGLAAGVKLNEPHERLVGEWMIGIAAGEEEIGVGGEIEAAMLAIAVGELHEELAGVVGA